MSVGWFFFRCGILIYHVTWRKEFIDSRHCENYATEELFIFFFLIFLLQKISVCFITFKRNLTFRNRAMDVEKNCLGWWRKCWNVRKVKKSSRNGWKISVTSPCILFAGHRCDVQRLFRVLNEIHQSTWHVVGPWDSIITFTVFTKADENRVDCHLINSKKTMANQKRKNTTNYYRNWCIMKARFVLK